MMNTLMRIAWSAFVLITAPFWLVVMIAWMWTVNYQAEQEYKPRKRNKKD